MKINRAAFISNLLMIFLGLTACSALQAAAPNPIATPEPSNTLVPVLESNPTATVQPLATPVLPTATPPDTPTVYVYTKYMFSFQLPPGWGLEEIVWEEMEGPTQALVLTKDHFRIVLHFKTVFEDIFLGPRGIARGELVKMDKINFFGRQLNGYSLVFEGKTKMLSFIEPYYHLIIGMGVVRNSSVLGHQKPLKSS